MDSATPPSGGAQNDSMVGEVQGTYRNEGKVSVLFLWSWFFSIVVNSLCTAQTRGESFYSRSFPITFREGFRIDPWKQHLFIKFLSSYWRLRIYSDRFLNVILHEGLSCPKLQNPPLIRMDSATPHSAGAQNENMLRGVQGSYRNEGKVQSCSYGADYLDCR